MSQRGKIAGWVAKRYVRGRTVRRLYDRQFGKCYYCGVIMSLVGRHPRTATIDHIVPRSKGGKTEEGNLVAACQACNAAKGDALPGEPWGRVPKPRTTRDDDPVETESRPHPYPC